MSRITGKIDTTSGNSESEAVDVFYTPKLYSRDNYNPPKLYLRDNDNPPKLYLRDNDNPPKLYLRDNDNPPKLYLRNNDNPPKLYLRNNDNPPKLYLRDNPPKPIMISSIKRVSRKNPSPKTIRISSIKRVSRKNPSSKMKTSCSKKASPKMKASRIKKLFCKIKASRSKKASPKMKTSRSKKASRDRRRMKVYKFSKSKGRRVFVCGKYTNPEICDSKLDCYFDLSRKTCRPRKGEMTPKMKTSCSKKASRDRRRMKVYKVSKSRGRRVSVCGKYTNPEICDSKLDCYFDLSRKTCRPRKGEMIQQGPQLPMFYL